MLLHNQGIPDWEEKLEIVRQLLGKMTNQEVADDVFSRPQDRERALKVADNFRKWKDHKPRNADARRFFEGVAGRLGCSDDVTCSMLIDSPIADFIKYLPEQKQAPARLILSRINPVKYGSSNLNQRDNAPQVMKDLGIEELNAIWLRHKGPVETLKAGLSIGRIDQRHYYLDPDSSNAWGALVRADAYPTYNHCRAGLQALLKNKQWNQMLQSIQPSTTVMLAGGGAPTKDLLFLRHLLTRPYLNQERIHYYLIDISMYMLRDSVLWICEHGRTLEGFARVSIEPIHGDVLEMTESERHRFHQYGAAIFAITAGTIGNFSESKFFQSLDRVASHGDLLIISADTLDGLTGKDKRTLIRKYNNPQFRQWIRPVIKSIMSDLNGNVRGPIDSILDQIRVELCSGVNSLSDVPDSSSIVLTLDIEGREIVLLTSTRYQSLKLSAYASQYGWEHVCEIPSPLYPRFKQFLFRRNTMEKSGN